MVTSPVLIRPGTYAAALPLRPVMVFIPEQKRQIVAQFRQNSLLRLKPGDEAEVVFNALPGRILREAHRNSAGGAGEPIRRRVRSSR